MWQRKLEPVYFPAKHPLSHELKYTDRPRTIKGGKFTERYCAVFYKYHAAMLFFKQKVAQII